MRGVAWQRRRPLFATEHIRLANAVEVTSCVGLEIVHGKGVSETACAEMGAQCCQKCVNGIAVETTNLGSGDEIRIGSYRWVLRLPD